MKSTLFALGLAIPFLLMLSGCITVHDTLLLRNVEVKGSPAQPPIHITGPNTQAKTAYASPFLSIGGGTVSTSLRRQYAGPIGDSLPDFAPEGLTWDVPRVTYGMDLDIAATNTFAFNAGVSGSVGEERQFTSYYAGVALYSARPSVSFRFDLGFQVIDIEYAGATVVLRSVDASPTDTLYYLDRGKKFHPNLFANLTLNSAYENRDINWFVQVGISPQTLTSFVPRKTVEEISGPYIVSDERAESSVFWLAATPGVYVSIPGNNRMILGVRFMKEMRADESNPDYLVMPVLKFDVAI